MLFPCALNALQALILVILVITLWDRYYYDSPYLADEESEAQRDGAGSHCSSVVEQDLNAGRLAGYSVCLHRHDTTLILELSTTIGKNVKATRTHGEIHRLKTPSFNDPCWPLWDSTTSESGSALNRAGSSHLVLILAEFLHLSTSQPAAMRIKRVILAKP